MITQQFRTPASAGGVFLHREDQIEARPSRRGFLASAAVTLAALTVPPLLPAPARDLAETWTLAERDAWTTAEMLRVWQKDPWQVVEALWAIGVDVPDVLVIHAERCARRAVA